LNKEKAFFRCFFADIMQHSAEFGESFGWLTR